VGFSRKVVIRFLIPSMNLRDRNEERDVPSLAMNGGDEEVVAISIRRHISPTCHQSVVSDGSGSGESVNENKESKISPGDVLGK
jgi:hypothetical protein